MEQLGKAMEKIGLSKERAELRQLAAGRSGERWLRLAVLAAMLAFCCAGQGFAQSAAKAGAEQKAAAIRAQVPTAFRTTAITGSVNELQNHVVINSVGAIYSVRKSNVLIASYSTTNAPDDSGDTSVTNTAGKSVPVSKKCHYTPVVSLPDFNSQPVTEGCRRDLAMGRARLIASGQRVLVAGVDVYVDKDRVELLLLEYHKTKGVESPRYVSQFAVQFPVGFLMTADATKIAAAIKPFLAPSDDPIVSTPYLADAPPPVYTLEDNLAGAFSSTAYQLEAGTSSPGAVLKVKASRFIRAIPQAMPAIGCTPVLRDGRAKDPGFMCKSLAQNSVYMAPEDELAVKSVKVESKKDKDSVRLELIDMSQNDPTPQMNGSKAHYHGAIDIEFQKGSLGSSDVAKVTEQVSAAFNVTGLVAVGGAPGAAGGTAIAGGSATPPAALNTVPVPTVAAPPQTLEDQLKTLYKLTTVGDGASVASRGTALTVTTDKLLLGTPYAKPAMCAASVVEGTPKPPAAACVTPLRPAIARHDAAYFAKGQKVDVVSIKVDMSKETVAFELIDDASAAGGPAAAPRFHTMVNFVFPTGYLESSDAGQVGALVNSVLETPAGQA